MFQNTCILQDKNMTGSIILIRTKKPKLPLNCYKPLQIKGY